MNITTSTMGVVGNQNQGVGGSNSNNHSRSGSGSSRNNNHKLHNDKSKRKKMASGLSWGKATDATSSGKGGGGGSRLERGDPMYDSDEDGEEDANFKYKKFVKEEEKQKKDYDASFHKLSNEILEEYFDSEDVKEVEAQLRKEFEDNVEYLPRFVKKSIYKSSCMKGRERELVSRLFVALRTFDFLTEDDIRKGFEHVLANIDDLYLDCRNAIEIVGQFLARAVNDECLSPKAISHDLTQVEAIYSHEQAMQAIGIAKTLLSINHHGSRLENIWSDDGRIATVEDLKRKIKDMVEEYLDSLNKGEVVKEVKDMASPHFMHEVVKQFLIIGCIEKKQEQSLIDVFATLKDECVVSNEQFILGFSRVYNRLSDLKLDSPHAEESFENISKKAKEAQIIPSSLFQ